MQFIGQLLGVCRHVTAGIGRIYTCQLAISNQKRCCKTLPLGTNKPAVFKANIRSNAFSAGHA